jgi:hypothetical protein
VKLLEIQSSPRGESSDSITLTKSFIEACKSDNGSIVVDTLNVWHERLPEFDSEAIGAKYKAVKHETMTEAESKVWQRIQLLIQAAFELHGSYASRDPKEAAQFGVKVIVLDMPRPPKHPQNAVIDVGGNGHMPTKD